MEGGNSSGIFMAALQVSFVQNVLLVMNKSLKTKKRSENFEKTFGL